MFRSSGVNLTGRRVTLRPLLAEDFEAYSDVRQRCADWLLQWEPKPLPGSPDPAIDQRTYLARLSARDRDRQLGTGYGFGVFIADPTGAQRFVGEVNINAVQRGPFQNAYIGYWIDQAVAGNGYMPEAVTIAMRFCFEDLALHRIQISIIPRNFRSKRVVEKLGLRHEGTALKYLEINGTWEDHDRYAMTSDEWEQRRGDFGSLLQ
jgi:ribosomal-protein-alanine N-acetyltransferase